MRGWLPLLLVFLTRTREVPAEEKPPRDLERNLEAVTEGHRGLEAFQRGDFSGCHRSFTRAEALAHSPTFLLFMARCLERQGALLEARAIYERIATEKLAPAAPAPWVSAVREAAIEHAALVPRIPSIVVSVLNAPNAEVVLLLDGRRLKPDALDRGLELDPGEHHLTGRRSDGARAEVRFVLEEGQRAFAVELSFSAEYPSHNALGGPNAQATRPPALAAARSDLVHTAGYIATGVGLTGLLLGSVAGVVALVRLSDLKARCEGTRCDVNDKPQLAEVRRLATVADVGFLAAAAGLGTGAVLFWVVPKAPTATAGGGAGAVLTARVTF